MTDRILISDLRYFAFHGLLPEETTLGLFPGVAAPPAKKRTRAR